MKVPSLNTLFTQAVIELRRSEISEEKADSEMLDLNDRELLESAVSAVLGRLNRAYSKGFEDGFNLVLANPDLLNVSPNERESFMYAMCDKMYLKSC